MTAGNASLKAKIAALRAKTQSAGCTEAEAIAAAEMAAKLMREHGIADADLAMSEAEVTEKTTRVTWRTKVAATVAHLTNTAVMMTVTSAGPTITFIGREPGPEIALYLRDICFRAVETEVKGFKAGTFYKRRRTVSTRRQAVADFTAGLIQRISWRLLELFKDQRRADHKTEAEAALVRRFPRAVDVKIKKIKARFSQAATDGWIAGGRVEIHHGVSTPVALQIEGGS